MLDRYEKYMADVEAGKVVACKWVKLAVARQRSDLKRQKDKAFPYYFDENAAKAVLYFLTILKHVSGEWAGRPFQPADFQAFRFAVLFGWKRKDNNRRRFRRAYLEVARKQGKSFEASAISMIGLILDGEAKAQIFSAATTRDQAKIVFEGCQDMARALITDSESAKKELKVWAQSVEYKPTGGTIKALSSDAQKLDGHSPHIAIIDEYHEHATNKVLKVMETGMGARSQPLSFIITTAGFNIEGPCYRLRKTAMQILEGVKQDETFFSIIYTLDEGDEWADESTWIKANPNIGVSPSWDFMRAEFTKAKNEGAEAEVQFKTKNLNMWVSAASTWIQDEKWMACPPMPDLAGRICYGGLDLAEVYDFTAFCACYPPATSGGVYAFKWWYWINEEAAARMSSRGVNIYQWAEQGYVTITPGNMVDVERCIEEIAAFGPSIGLQSTAFDNWGTKTNELKMQEVGMICHQFRQGFKSMSPAMKDIERLVGTSCLAHGDNPVTRWMLSNVEAERDAAANIKPSRKRKENKIDGIVAMIMALGEALTFAGKEQQSYLFEEDLITF